MIARQSPEAQGIIRALLAENSPARLRAELDELRRQGKGKTPQNSSLPPSTRHPHAKPPQQKPKSKKKRGGQPGHKKHERPLVPTSECDEVQELKPSECRKCGAPLRGRDSTPLRHQVWELPEIKPHVTEYRRHRLALVPDCGELTCAKLPSGVPQGQSGPRLVAFTALLMAYYRQSKRRTAEFLAALLGQPCCPALDGEDAAPSHGGPPGSVRRTGGPIADGRCAGHRRIADKGSPAAQVVAVDVRRQQLYSLCAADHPRRDSPFQDLLTDAFDGRSELRSGEDVLEPGEVAVVLGRI